jgi:hypothetical protein
VTDAPASILSRAIAAYFKAESDEGGAYFAEMADWSPPSARYDGTFEPDKLATEALQALSEAGYVVEKAEQDGQQLSNMGQAALDVCLPILKRHWTGNRSASMNPELEYLTLEMGEAAFKTLRARTADRYRPNPDPYPQFGRPPAPRVLRGSCGPTADDPQSGRV